MTRKKTGIPVHRKSAVDASRYGSLAILPSERSIRTSIQSSEQRYAKLSTKQLPTAFKMRPENKIENTVK